MISALDDLRLALPIYPTVIFRDLFFLTGCYFLYMASITLSLSTESISKRWFFLRICVYKESLPIEFFLLMASLKKYVVSAIGFKTALGLDLNLRSDVGNWILPVLSLYWSNPNGGNLTMLSAAREYGLYLYWREPLIIKESRVWDSMRD